jgi:hypothetical protein
MSTNWQLTQYQICEVALVSVGAHVLGQTIDPEKLVLCKKYLNLVSQSLQLEGIHLWAVQGSQTLYQAGVPQTTFTAGTSTYDLPDDALDVTEMMRRDSAGQDQWMMPIRREQYMLIANKAIPGPPTQYCIVPIVPLVVGTHTIQGRLKVIFFPVPNNSTDAAVYNYNRKLADFDGGTADPDYPQRWVGVLTAGLKCHLSDWSGLPIVERDRFQKLFEVEKQRAQHSDSERGPVIFTPRLYNPWSRWY